ncbi:hypothetical protein ACIO8F_28935 [Streptomyces sp. NPDC087228]|uniref:hypothetical protein n=1 Tax=unclassified Streptomyces TaxID=2593676 RepID=UPI003817F78F
MSRGRPRDTLRTRLTLAYGALFAVVAMTLVALLYGFMMHVPIYSENPVTAGIPARGRSPAGQSAQSGVPAPGSGAVSPDCGSPPVAGRPRP